jgi:hypothetical protein
MNGRSAFQFIFAFFLFWACAVTVARAAENGVRPFAPWMTFRDGMDESIRNSGPVAQTTGTRAYAAGKTMPDAPVMTPRDTIDLINQIYDRNPVRLSALEVAYSTRIVDEVRQFGYDQFGASKEEKKETGNEKKEETQPSTTMPAGAVTACASRFAASVRTANFIMSAVRGN